MQSDTQRANRTITSPLKAIREHCLECVGRSSPEVDLCPATLCALYKYRYGRRPPAEKRKLSPETIKRLKVMSDKAKAGVKS
jgi:hypothetical protein